MTQPQVAQMEVAVEDIGKDGNCRSHMDPVKLKELAANIKKVGVLEPALLRRNEKGQLILVAGARRLEACKIAGLKTIRALILDIDAQEAKEIQALENLHREDLSPLDQARTFKALLESKKHTIESLAAQVDKSVAFVTRSLRLLELPAAGLKALENGILTPAHAHQIVRAPASYHEKLVAYSTTKLWGDRYPSVQELRDYIHKHIEKDLARAPFPKDVAYGAAGPCSTCPFNTGNQNVLFEGAAEGNCTNPSCFNQKCLTFDRELRVQGERRYPNLGFAGTASDDGNSVKRIKKTVVVDEKDAKIQKAIKEHPDQFAYGILKSGPWSSYRKPRLVLVCKDPKLAGQMEDNRYSGYRPPTPEELAKQAFVQDQVAIGLNKATLAILGIKKEFFVQVFEDLWEEGWMAADLLRLLVAQGWQPTDETKEIFPKKFLESFSVETLTKLFLVLFLNRHRDAWEAFTKRQKVDVDSLAKKLRASAEKAWDAKPASEKAPKKEVAA